ncbi:hypothetical protein JCM6882_004777 [Rhodosporidiobolus microsporus]
MSGEIVFYDDERFSYDCAKGVSEEDAWKKAEGAVPVDSQVTSGAACAAKVKVSGSSATLYGNIGKEGSSWGCSSDSGETYTWYSSGEQSEEIFTGLHEVAISNTPAGGSSLQLVAVAVGTGNDKADEIEYSTIAEPSAAVNTAVRIAMATSSDPNLAATSTGGDLAPTAESGADVPAASTTFPVSNDSFSASSSPSAASGASESSSSTFGGVSSMQLSVIIGAGLLIVLMIGGALTLNTASIILSAFLFLFCIAILFVGIRLRRGYGSRENGKVWQSTKEGMGLEEQGGNYASNGLVYSCPSSTSSDDGWAEQRSYFDNGNGGTTWTSKMATSGAGCSVKFSFEGTDGFFRGWIGPGQGTYSCSSDGGETEEWYTGYSSTITTTYLCAYYGSKNESYNVVLTNGGDGALAINDWWWSTEQKYNVSVSQPTASPPSTSTSASSATSTSSASSTSSSSLSATGSASSSSSPTASAEAANDNKTNLAPFIALAVAFGAIVLIVVLLCICTRTQKKQTGGGVVIRVKQQDEEAEKSVGVRRKRKKEPHSDESTEEP